MNRKRIVTIAASALLLIAVIVLVILTVTGRGFGRDKVLREVDIDDPLMDEMLNPHEEDMDPDIYASLYGTIEGGGGVADSEEDAGMMGSVISCEIYRVDELHAIVEFVGLDVYFSAFELNWGPFALRMTAQDEQIETCTLSDITFGDELPAPRISTVDGRLSLEISLPSDKEYSLYDEGMTDPIASVAFGGVDAEWEPVDCYLNEGKPIE